MCLLIVVVRPKDRQNNSACRLRARLSRFWTHMWRKAVAEMLDSTSSDGDSIESADDFSREIESPPPPYNLTLGDGGP